MHKISACKPRTVQPFLVAVLTFAVLAMPFVAVLECRHFDQAPTSISSSRAASVQPPPRYVHSLTVCLAD